MTSDVVVVYHKIPILQKQPFYIVSQYYIIKHPFYIYNVLHCLALLCNIPINNPFTDTTFNVVFHYYVNNPFTDTTFNVVFHYYVKYPFTDTTFYTVGLFHYYLKHQFYTYIVVHCLALL